MAEASNQIQTLSDLGIQRAQVIRAIESLKASGNDVHPGNVALELGVPRSFLYAEFEYLDLIYESANRAYGHDKVIQDLLKVIQEAHKKINSLEKEMFVLKKASEQSFNQGFVQGAALNFKKNRSHDQETDDLLEIWSRGVLFLDGQAELDPQKIKKAYRSLIAMLHPDKSGQDSAEQMDLLYQAYSYLMDIYQQT